MSTESQYYRYNPEKRNIFIEINQGRSNIVGAAIAGIFAIFASHASAIVEVFLRKRFGERYITLSQSIGLFIAMNLILPWVDKVFRLDMRDGDIFLLVFSLIYLGLSIYHRMEISKYGTAYDFKRFSLSDGEIAPFWYKIIGRRFLGFKISRYTVHIFLEPAIPFLIGAALMLTEYTRMVGVLLFVCGITYSMRNLSKAQQGRNWVLDNIDKQITNEMKYDVFIGRKPKKDTKGVYLPMDLPENPEVVESLYEMVDTSFESTGDFWVNDELDGTPEDRASESGGGVSGG